MNASHTYMRDTVSKARVTCPCCLRSIKTKANGQMVRHGWKEEGRRVGQWGCGYQWGSCNGWDMLPLETSDRDALRVVAGLTKEIEALTTEIKRHEAGELDHYVTKVRAADLGSSEFKDEEAARKSRSLVELDKAGFEYTLEEVKPTKHWQRHSTWWAKVTVPKGQDSYKEYQVYVPSYEKLRAKAQAELESICQGLKGARTSVVVAVEHHKANPYKAEAEKPERKGPTVHWACKWKGRREQVVGKCSQYSMSPRYSATTEDPSKVTCKRCLKKLAES